MRAINLIPPEDRHGEAAPIRTGPVIYLIVAALSLVLIGVTAVTLLNNDLEEKQDEVALLERQQAEAEARAASLQSFVEFESLKAARMNTISKLATSRFDWERVMNELARVLPTRVWLTELSGSVVGGAGSDDGGDAGIAGPSLTLTGCARSQRGISRLITSLEDIDGVTRVLAENGEKGAGASGATGDGCQTRNFVAAFTAVVAFDQVSIDPNLLPPAPPASPVAPAPEGGEEQPAPATSEPTPGLAESSTDDGDVAGVEAQKDADASSVTEAGGKVQKAKNLASGGSG